MLAIRMQRTGRKGHAQFRVVVQDSRQTPTSGKVVAQIGTYNPHTKTAVLAKEKAEFYLTNGAQPSDRVAHLLKQEGVKLPEWVSLEAKKEGTLRNPEKLRKNRPAEAAASEEASEAPAEPAAETPTEAVETSAEEAAPAEEVSSEAPAAEEAPTEEPTAEAEQPTATEKPVEEAEKPAE
jgi:small subunit ribosomal protein S16